MEHYDRDGDRDGDKDRDGDDKGRDGDRFERGLEREERERRTDGRRERKERDLEGWFKSDDWADSDGSFMAEACRPILRRGVGEDAFAVVVCVLPPGEMSELDLDGEFEEGFGEFAMPDIPLELLPFFGLMDEEWLDEDEWPFEGEGSPFEDGPWPFGGDGGERQGVPWPFRGDGRPFGGERWPFGMAPAPLDRDGGQFDGVPWPFMDDGGQFGWVPVPLDRDGGQFEGVPWPFGGDGGQFEGDGWSFGWRSAPEGDGGLFDEDMYEDEIWPFGGGIEIPFGEGARGFWYGNDGTEDGFCFSQGDQVNCYSSSDLLPGNAADQFEQLMEMLRSVGLGDLFGFDFEFGESPAEESSDAADA